MNEPTYRSAKDAGVFVSTVQKIFEWSRDGEGKLSDIRDHLTYLLLRKDPETNRDVPLDLKAKIDPPEDILHLREAAKLAIERYIGHDEARAKPYAQLQLLVRFGNGIGTWVNQTEVALLILSMWVFHVDLETSDICTIYDCLSLNSDHNAVKPANDESAFVSTTPRYGSFVSNTIVRLLETDTPTRAVLRELSYVGAFASLIRACRMTEPTHKVHELLRREVEYLRSRRQSLIEK